MKVEEPNYQKQFEAAVRCIQGLPRKGSSYHPSYEEMLRFYSYYKQATMGQCQIPRPGFWDPIGRYKWDAWNRLGKMTKKEAMVAYIQEMKKSAQKVIDTVPMDETSEDMFDYFKPLYEVIDDMPRPPESFFKKKLGLGHVEESVKSMQGTSDSEGEVFCDSLEQMEPEQGRRPSAKKTSAMNHLQEIQVGDTSGHQPPMPMPASTWEEKQSKSDPQTIPVERDFDTANVSAWQEVDERLRSTIQALQKNMEEVMRRLSRLESLASFQEPSRQPAHLTPSTLLFLLAWPLIVQWLLGRFQSWKR